MSKVAVYSTHNYTASIANQLSRLDVHYVEAASNEAFRTLVAQDKFDLIVLDSSSEHSIFEVMKTIDHEPANQARKHSLSGARENLLRTRNDVCQ